MAVDKARRAVNRRLQRERDKAKNPHFKAAQLRLYGENCYLCDEPLDLDAMPYDPRAHQTDHVESLANGGRTSHQNCRPSHRACNRIKGDALTPAEARHEIAKQRAAAAAVEAVELGSDTPLRPSPTGRGYFRDSRGRVYSRGSDGKPQRQSREW